VNAIIRKLAPSATDMIRADHTRVLASFHRYSIASAPRVKQGLANTICLSLEIHAQIEEEIFYPAMREAGSALIKELIPGHQEMRRLIAALRNMDAADPEFDQTFMELMRDVMHHVADEETILLTHAESVLADRLGELGARMMHRRVRLSAPRAPEMARNTASAASPNALLMALGTLLAGALVLRRWRRHGSPVKMG
jgi:hypothetical protein